MKTVRAMTFWGGLLALWLQAFAVVASGEESKYSGSMIARVVTAGEMVVGISTAEPWVMKSGSGQWLGYDIDVARQLGRSLGVNIKFQPLPWNRLITELEAGRVDIIISGMTITTSRNLAVNFTIPYSSSGIGILANKRQTKSITTLDQFNQKSVTMAVRTGSESVAVAIQNMPDAQLRQFDNEQSMVAAVRSGEVTAMLASTPLPELMVGRYPNELAMPVTDRLQRTSEAMAIGKQDADSMNVLNNWIFQNLENGWLQDRHDYWFLTTKWRDLLK